MNHCYFALLALLILVGSSSNVDAQRMTRAEREARSLYAAGEEAFGSGDYERALDYFERAYALSPRAALLYNIAASADRMRDDARALEAFREYLAEEPDSARRAEVEARIAYLEAADDPVEAEEPITEEPTAEPEATPSSGEIRVHPAAIATLVGAGVLFLSFGTFATLTAVEDQSLADSCGRNVGAMCGPEQVGALEAYGVVADVSWIAGAAAAVAGLVLLFVLPPEPEAPNLAVAPWLAPEGGGAAVWGQW